jgi:hypothetical protein
MRSTAPYADQPRLAAATAHRSAGTGMASIPRAERRRNG